MQLQVILADTPELRRMGLMGVRSLPRDVGMLFVFPSGGYHSFWMKNTLIPLDLVGMDEHFIIRQIYRGAVPGDLRQIRIEGLYVLEINAGRAEALQEGDSLVLVP